MRHKLVRGVAVVAIAAAVLCTYVWWTSGQSGQASRVRAVLAEATGIVAEARRDRTASLAATEFEAVEQLVGQANQALVEDQLQQAAERADEALAKAAAARDLARERHAAMRAATLTRVTGRVLHRSMDDVSWEDAHVDLNLFDGDRVATREASEAQLQFDEGNEMTVAPASVVVIRRLANSGASSDLNMELSVAEGSVRSTVSRLADRDVHMAVRLPNADIIVDTAGLDAGQHIEFGTEVKADDSSRISVFHGKAQVKTLTGQVVTMSNQYADVATSGAIGKPKELPPMVTIVSPREGDEMLVNAHGSALSFRWAVGSPCRRVRLEVAGEPSFARHEFDERIEGDRKQIAGLAEGEHHWRASCVDEDGVQGPSAGSARFRVGRDSSPPRLEVLAPQARSVVTTETVIAKCRTEAKARVFVNGEEAQGGAGGLFQTTVRLQPGLNRILFEALDGAGNASSERLFVTYAQ